MYVCVCPTRKLKDDVEFSLRAIPLGGYVAFPQILTLDPGGMHSMYVCMYVCMLKALNVSVVCLYNIMYAFE